jgi:hypothetical protein
MENSIIFHQKLLLLFAIEVYSFTNFAKQAMQGVKQDDANMKMTDTNMQMT